MRRIFRQTVLRKGRDSSELSNTDDEESTPQRQQVLSHTTHQAYDVSIGTKGGASGRAQRDEQILHRQPSTESHFRVSRVIVDKTEPFPPLARLPHPFAAASPPFSMTFNDERSDAQHLEQRRDISSAARAYLPNSASFFTSSTSLDLLSNAKTNQDKQSRTIPSWASSVMLHAASSPMCASNSSLRMLHAKRSYGRSTEHDHHEETEDSSNESRGREATETISTKHSVPSQRTSSCPALRGAFHAQRQRQSMMLSMDNASSNVDEFGRQITRDDGNSMKLRSGRSNQFLSPPPSVPTPHNTRDSDRRTLSLSTLLAEPSKTNRHTFGNALAPELDFCPSPMHSSTPMQLADNMASRDRFDVASVPPSRPNSASSNSSTHSSLRAARRMASNDLLPSPQKSVFRFPALCSAAASEHSGSSRSSPSLSSARMHAIILRANSVPAAAQAPLEAPHPPARAIMANINTKLPQTPQLGSPIRLTSEAVDCASCVNDVTSDHHSSSDCYDEYSSQGDASEDDGCVFEFPVRKPRSVKSASCLQGDGPRAQAFYQSTSMPTVKIETADAESTEGAAILTTTELGTPVAQRSRSGSESSVRTILSQQRFVMQRLRGSQRWNSTMTEVPVSRHNEAALALRSSWTLCAAEDEVDSSMTKDIGKNSEAGLVTHVLQKVTPASAPLCKTIERADKATQTDHIPPPRPTRHRDRMSKNKSAAASPASSSQVPGICILLASPRRLDDEYVNFEQPHSLFSQALPKVSVDSLDARLLMPIDLRSSDGVAYYGEYDEDDYDDDAKSKVAGILDVGLGIGSVFQGELESMLDSITSDIEQDKRGAAKRHPIPYGDDEYVSSLLTTVPRTAPVPPSESAAASPPSLPSSDKTPRESTTTAAIEAMLAQLQRAQSSPHNVSPLGVGGRRHEKQLQLYSIVKGSA